MSPERQIEVHSLLMDRPRYLRILPDNVLRETKFDEKQVARWSLIVTKHSSEILHRSAHTDSMQKCDNKRLFNDQATLFSLALSSICDDRQENNSNSFHAPVCDLER